MSYNIAIVEDDPQQREHYAVALRGKGYRVSEYANRMQAIHGFAQQLPDLAAFRIVEPCRDYGA